MVGMLFPTTYRERFLQALNTLDLKLVDEAIEWFRQARAEGKTIFVAGNGGSSATATHLVCDLVKDASYGRKARFKAMTLLDSMPTLSAYANDVHFHDAMSETLRNFAEPGDLLMTISGSGNSENLVRAMEFANKHGLRTLALTGRDGGKLGAMAQLELRVPDPHMGRIQDVHHIVCHMICYSFVESEPVEV
jgi:D-sedoheptulose 7-phosphate isomerase